MEPVDIRDREDIRHRDVMALNFVRSGCPYVFRRHFRQGLRSHIMEVLDPMDVRLETDGVIKDGMRWFPSPRPLFMLRLFRKRFCSAVEAHEEIRRLRVIEQFLPPDQLARSSEFIVSYRTPDACPMLLCGLQEYAPGYELDPWRLGRIGVLAELIPRMRRTSDRLLDAHQFRSRLRHHAGRFTAGIRAMINEAGMIPDLAGERNLVMTDRGNIRLVDINNINEIRMDDTIYLDDKGYPICDKSVEALILMEEHLLGRKPDGGDPLVQVFLNADRKKHVRDHDARFHRRFETANS